MRSAPTLKIWMTPFASVAMLEKLALLKIALCNAPLVRRASASRTSTGTVALRSVIGPCCALENAHGATGRRRTDSIGTASRRGLSGQLRISVAAGTLTGSARHIVVGGARRPPNGDRDERSPSSLVGRG